MIFGFYYFSDVFPLDNDGDEKDKREEYSVDEHDHDDEDSDEEQGHCKPPQKKSIKKPSHRQRINQPPACDIIFLGNELWLPPTEECSISRSSGAIASLKTWPANQTYTWSKSLESKLTQMHKKLKTLWLFEC